MEKVVPVGQGGGVIVDGKQTDLTFSVLKAGADHSGVAQKFAQTLGGQY